MDLPSLPTGSQQLPNNLQERCMICPYNNRHKLHPRKFPRHIHKCRKEQTRKYLRQFTTCRFNSLHIFSVHEIAIHELSCPNRESIIWLHQELLDGPRVLVEETSEVTDCSDRGQEGRQEQGDLSTKQEDQLNSCDDGSLEGQISESGSSREYTRYAHSPKDGGYCVKSQFAVQESALFSRQTADLRKPQSGSKALLLANHRPKEQNSRGRNSKPCSKGRNESSLQTVSVKKSMISQPPHSPRKKQQGSLPKNSNPARSLQGAVPPSPGPAASGEIEFSQCSQCCRIVCDPSIKVWRNKKLTKLLKIYQKLEEDEEQIKEYRKLLPKFDQSMKPKALQFDGQTNQRIKQQQGQKNRKKQVTRQKIQSKTSTKSEESTKQAIYISNSSANQSAVIGKVQKQEQDLKSQSAYSKYNTTILAHNINHLLFQQSTTFSAEAEEHSTLKTPVKLLVVPKQQNHDCRATEITCRTSEDHIMSDNQLSRKIAQQGSSSARNRLSPNLDLHTGLIDRIRHHSKPRPQIH